MSVRALDLPAGSEVANFLRARALDTAAAGGPWVLDVSPRPRFSAFRSEFSLNSGLPYARNDGPAWAGRGLNAQLSGVASYTRGGLRVRLAPVAWIAQNSDFTLVPLAPTSPPGGPFADPQRPRTIDLPQRFGTGSVARIDPGESEISFDVWLVRAALTSAARHIGAGTYHSMIMQGDAPGFPRLELSVPVGLRTPIGTFSGVLASGRIAQTMWAPQRREGARHGSFIEARWRPLHTERLVLGAARFYHRDWLGIRPKDILVPFGSLFFDDQLFGEGDPDNQLAMLFAAVRIPEAGLEFFGEFGKNDRSLDMRDLAAELEHNSAWLFGVQKVWRDDLGRLWTLNGTSASARIPPIIRFRPQASFYDHFPIRQGHTNRGQLLGTPLLEREGGAELRLDRYDHRGRTGLILSTRYLPNERAEAVDEDLLRQEWSAQFEILRASPRGHHYFARVGAVADLNRHPTLGDAYNLTLAFGVVLRP
jgi:hypothetical protein